MTRPPHRWVRRDETRTTLGEWVFVFIVLALAVIGATLVQGQEVVFGLDPLLKRTEDGMRAVQAYRLTAREFPELHRSAAPGDTCWAINADTYRWQVCIILSDTTIRYLPGTDVGVPIRPTHRPPMNRRRPNIQGR